MKLPNFLEFAQLNNLRKLINAPLNKDFLVQSRLSPLAMKLLSGGEIEGLTLEDIVIDGEGLLEIDGQKVVVYIRDQHTNMDYVPETSNYRYHFSFCKTLKEFQEKGKSDKYVATKTAKFRIDWKRFGRPIGEAEYDLNVCKWCLGNIDYRGYSSATKIRREEIWENFSREQYFKEYDSGVVDYSRYTADTAPKNEYTKADGHGTEDWANISRRIRAERGNKCEKCGSTKNLEVDHINELKYDVRPENLQVLCHYCHKKKHPHMSPFKKY